MTTTTDGATDDDPSYKLSLLYTTAHLKKTVRYNFLLKLSEITTSYESNARLIQDPVHIANTFTEDIHMVQRCHIALQTINNCHVKSMENDNLALYTVEFLGLLPLLQ